MTIHQPIRTPRKVQRSTSAIITTGGLLVVNEGAPISSGQETPLRSRQSGATRRALMVLSIVGLTACPQETAVWIPPGSTAGNLTVHFGRDHGRNREVALGVVRVHKCADSIGAGGRAADAGAMWVLYATDRRAPMVSKVRYGEALPGFRSTVGPVSLIPGCYFVQISGTGVTRFRVASNGTVSDEGRPW
jgi:hypothetical protein